MILQALVDLYRRKEDELPQYGFERKEIPFIIAIAEDGSFVDIDDTRSGTGKAQKSRPFVVPQSIKRSMNIDSNVFWDKVSCALGQGEPGKEERTAKLHAAFVQIVESFARELPAEIGVQALRKFFQKADYRDLFAHSAWAEILKTGANVSFRLAHETELICQSPAFRSVYKDSIKSAHGQNEAQLDGTPNPVKQCLLSGLPDEVERLHASIKGVWGAQSSGANIALRRNSR